MSRLGSGPTRGRMMESETRGTLGTVVQRYETDDGKRGRTALVALLIGLAALAVGIPVTISSFEQVATGSVTASGLVLGLALVCLWAGVSNGLRWANQHGEVFTVREGGLTHYRAGRTRHIPWEDIATVKDQGQDNFLSRSLGWGVHCHVKVKDGGRRLLISGFTQDAEDLVATVTQAVHDGVRPRPPRAR